uniref:Cytoplasmic protein n=1 Tax=Heterorhabditis bacteriophora TaxID=37862 RepID=A0A1I7WNV7_HETBA
MVIKGHKRGRFNKDPSKQERGTSRGGGDQSYVQGRL